MEDRGKSLYALWIFIIVQVIQIVASSVIIMIVVGIKLIGKSSTIGWKNLIRAGHINDILQNGIDQNTQYLASVLSILVCGFIFLYWYRYETRGELKGHVKQFLKFKNIILLLCLGFGCQFTISGGMSILQKYFVKLFEDYAKQIDSINGGNSIVVLLLIAIIAPITEELIFRGVILHKTNRSLSFFGANLLQATLFGIYHFNLVQGIYAGILGFLLGMIYKKFNTIIAPILLHMIVNISSYTLVLIPQSNHVMITLMLIGIIVVVLVLYQLGAGRLFERKNESIFKGMN